MPSSFPRRPKMLKGALAVYEQQTPGTQPKLVIFQYNPEQIRRTLATRTPPADHGGNSGAAKEEALRAVGPPVETINIAVELDAADQLEQPSQNQPVVENGLYPALATLELLLYPSSIRAEQMEQLARQGEVQLSPADLPLVLLVWGKSRVVPVQLTNFSVTEEDFDPDLNPTRAKVELGMKVLTYIELTESSLGRDAFISYQKQKEGLARLHDTDSGPERTSRVLPSGTSLPQAR
ncbi:MAG: hypothetical protein U0835_17465 [Isosphaeraceae bacterium]